MAPHDAHGPFPRFWRALRRPPWRTFAVLALILAVSALAYLLWTPGLDLRDGRHDLRRNGIWLQHGWLGDDEWFQRNRKQELVPRFRDAARVRDLADRLRRHHITDVFPHLCPTRPSGEVPPVDAAQTRRFLQGFAGFRVMPWVGGVWGSQVFPDDAAWRLRFASSIASLLHTFPEFCGVHVNIEPCPSGNAAYLKLLDELRAALPGNKLLSVAAYPPPTWWHPVPDVHWEQPYWRQVARRVDQFVVMMYDTSIRYGKPYRHLMSSWTQEILDWSGDTGVLLGLPAYDDAGVGYHDPTVENLHNALLGIHAGLSRYETLPRHYQGVALYSEWEMDEAEWADFRERFLAGETKDR